jgi:hypothetical protein
MELGPGRVPILSGIQSDREPSWCRAPPSVIQFLGPLLPPQDFLGGDGNGTFTGVVNFNPGAFAGDQFFSCGDRLVPVSPSTWSRVTTILR